MSVPYDFRDLFPVSPLSFIAATFSKPKPHGQHDRNDTSTDDKEVNEDRINAHRNVVKVAVEERRVRNAVGKIRRVESIVFCIDLQEMTGHTSVKNVARTRYERDTKLALHTWCICERAPWKRTLRAIVRLASPRTIARA